MSTSRHGKEWEQKSLRRFEITRTNKCLIRRRDISPGLFNQLSDDAKALPADEKPLPDNANSNSTS